MKYPAKEEEPIRHCMLFELRKDNNATVVSKNICDIYPSALNLRKGQRWFLKFKLDNFDLSHACRSEKLTTLGKDMLRT